MGLTEDRQNGAMGPSHAPFRPAPVSVLRCPLRPRRGGCRQALALGIDVPGSVDAAEHRLQLDGIADGCAAYRAAMTEKLLRELEGLVVGWADTGAQ